MLPVADAMRAVPTIGAIAARTPRTCSASIPASPAAPRFSAYETAGRVDCDQRSDANEKERLEIEARCFE